MKIQVLLEAESNLTLTCQLRLIYCLTERGREYLLNNLEKQITQRMRCFALLDFLKALDILIILIGILELERVSFPS